MDDDTKKDKETPVDEVDFTSGYETQYAKEYRPLHKYNVPPPDPKNAWYRDLTTIAMVLFLIAMLLLGSVLLITLVFTSNPLVVMLIVISYLLVAAVFIYLEVKTKYVR